MGCILFSSRITRPFGTQRIVEVVWPGDERSRIRNMPASAVLSAARTIRRRTTLYPVARKFGVVGRSGYAQARQTYRPPAICRPTALFREWGTGRGKQVIGEDYVSAKVLL